MMLSAENLKLFENFRNIYEGEGSKMTGGNR